MNLHLQNVPPRNGYLWVRHGLKVLQRKPMALTSMFGLFLLCSLLLMLLPALGPLLVLAALPLVSLGFMLATHMVLQAQTPTMAVFAQPLQLTPQRRRSQLILGAAYAAATVLVMMLSDWVDGGAFGALQDALQQGEAGAAATKLALEDPRLFWGAVTRLGLTALLSVPFWHAPALVHWAGQGPMQALFSSTLGVWRNKSAFALSALAWASLVMLCSTALALPLSLLGLGVLLPLVAMVVGGIISTAFYCSLYFTFIDCFMFGAPKDVLDEPRA
ncbi:BPSS1780 family membrane protein [Roseateles sp. BYS180W]|uniref:BPSS1780 family membrane protein n=1 Tax=Roseateles rivi TaxID=3299028 RepID=A0ABW7FXP3_9BURK